MGIFAEDLDVDIISCMYPVELIWSSTPYEELNKVYKKKCDKFKEQIVDSMRDKVSLKNLQFLIDIVNGVIPGKRNKLYENIIRRAFWKAFSNMPIKSLSISINVQHYDGPMGVQRTIISRVSGHIGYTSLDYMVTMADNNFTAYCTGLPESLIQELPKMLDDKCLKGEISSYQLIDRIKDKQN